MYYFLSKSYTDHLKQLPLNQEYLFISIVSILHLLQITLEEVYKIMHKLMYMQKVLILYTLYLYITDMSNQQVHENCILLIIIYGTYRYVTVQI